MRDTIDVVIECTDSMISLALSGSMALQRIHSFFIPSRRIDAVRTRQERENEGSQEITNILQIFWVALAKSNQRTKEDIFRMITYLIIVLRKADKI